MMTPPQYDYAAVPLSAAGRIAADNWDRAADEKAGLQCKYFGAASVMRVPGRVQIAWADDNTLQVQTDAGTQTRHLRYGASAPAGERTWQGQSTAVWELPEAGRARNAPRGGQLKVVTTNMRAGLLRSNGVPYSDQAVLTEYFLKVTAPNKDEWLVVTSIVDDPQYLNEPFVTSTHFKKEPNNSKFTPTACAVPK